jgi:hypothetical protein
MKWEVHREEWKRKFVCGAKIKQLNFGGDATVNTPCLQQKDLSLNLSIRTMVTKW